MSKKSKILRSEYNSLLRQINLKSKRRYTITRLKYVFYISNAYGVIFSGSKDELDFFIMGLESYIYCEGN